MKYLILLATLLTLISCEKGSSQYKVMRNMNELSVPHTFNYAVIQSQCLKIDLAPTGINDGLVSIYSEFETLPNGKHQAVSGSKIVSTALVNGAAEVTFQLVNTSTSILIELWSDNENASIQTVAHVGNGPIVLP